MINDLLPVGEIRAVLRRHQPERQSSLRQAHSRRRVHHDSFPSFTIAGSVGRRRREQARRSVDGGKENSPLGPWARGCACSRSPSPSPHRHRGRPPPLPQPRRCAGPCGGGGGGGRCHRNETPHPQLPSSPFQMGLPSWAFSQNKKKSSKRPTFRALFRFHHVSRQWGTQPPLKRESHGLTGSRPRERLDGGRRIFNVDFYTFAL